MSALDKIADKQIKGMTKLELAIFTLWNSFLEDTLAEAAADELEAIFNQVEGRGEQVATLREEVERLRASNSRIFDDLHNQIHQTVGAKMERDELREQIADVNELLWEFSEYPNIGLGEKGFNKIEDYFKKYSQNKV